jgi:type IV secretion system protein VirB5
MDLALARANWRWACFLSLIANIVFALGLVSMASRSQIQPFLAVVDDTYRTLPVGPAGDVLANPTLLEGVTQVAVYDFIVRARAITADPLAQQDAAQRLWAFAGADSRTFLEGAFKERNPGVWAQEGRRVTVKVEALQLRSDRYWEVQWVETEWDPEGARVKAERWDARLRVEISPPTKLEVAAVNPAGVYVTQLSWAKRADLN